jgi:hypothetical protein
MNLIIKFKSLITKALKVFGNAEITGNISANDISIINLGTVSLPSYTFTIDPNTGMWSPAADTLAWSTNGVERMRVDSSGNVGIGTTTPSAKLHIEDSTLATVRVGSGTRRINLNSYAGDWNYQTSNGAPYVFGTADNNQLLFYQNNQERMRIQTGGNVGIGTTTPSARLHTVSTTEQLRLGYDASNYMSATVSSAGLVTLDAVGAGAGFVFSDDVQFDGTENTMPNQTLDAGNSSVMTLGLTDERYGPIGKYEKNPSTITLQNSLAVATGSLFNGRLDQTFVFGFGNVAGSPPNIMFVPFFVVKPKNFTKAAINIVSGASSTYNIEGCIYLPDENGYPLTQYGDVWTWDASATGKVEATINVGEIQGLFYVGIRPQAGAADWVADAGQTLTVRGVAQAGGGIGMILNQMFNIVPQAFDQFDGPVGVVSTGGATSMPANLSSPEIRRVGMWAAGNRHPSCILY